MAELWRPQARQAAFMERFEDEALYGGAAGGGKSDALVMEALRQVHVPHYKGLLLRKTFPQLRELIDKSLRYYARAFPRARYNESKHLWRFPSGAKIYFGSLQHTQDRTQYQGQAYDYIAFDELTHFTWDEYSYLMSRNRANGPNTRVYMRATANPGGVGHGWVKGRFISAGPPMRTVWERVDIDLPGGGRERRWRSRVFVPSNVFDNPILLDNDPGYLTRLASLPEAEKQALLYGSWDSFSGQVFTEWRNDPQHYADRRGSHVIEPFAIPREWTIVCGMDWGFSAPFSVGWYAVDFDKRLYRVRELYGWGGEPNAGAKLNPPEVARRIREIEEQDPNLKGRRIVRVADPAIWGTQTGLSVGDDFAAAGLFFEKGQHARLDGLMQIHNRLAFDGNGVPMLYVFRTCKHFIRTVPALVYSEARCEDVDTTGEDHAYDELRYVCMTHPIRPRRNEDNAPPAFDPLSDDTQPARLDRYSYFRTF